MNKEEKITMFIDTQNIEERYADELYKEYLEKENKQLKDKLNCDLEWSFKYDELKERIDKAIKHIEKHSKQSEVNFYGIPKCMVFQGNIEKVLDILKGDDK